MAIDPVTNALIQRDISEEKAQTEWDRFKASSAYLAMREKGFETFVADSRRLWESLGPDAISYPFHTNMMGKNEVERARIRNQMNDHDQKLVASIALAIISKDDAELGRLMRGLCESYINGLVDEWVDDNWRDWT